MPKHDTLERLRRAAELLSGADQPCDTTLLLEAWEYLKGLNNDDFPEDLQAAFSFLQREISRAKSEDLSAREVIFLAEKIRKLELMSLDSSHRSLHQSLDAPV